MATRVAGWSLLPVLALFAAWSCGGNEGGGETETAKQGSTRTTAEASTQTEQSLENPDTTQRTAVAAPVLNCGATAKVITSSNFLNGKNGADVDVPHGYGHRLRIRKGVVPDGEILWAFLVNDPYNKAVVQAYYFPGGESLDRPATGKRFRIKIQYGPCNNQDAEAVVRLEGDQVVETLTPIDSQPRQWIEVETDHLSTYAVAAPGGRNNARPSRP